MKLPHTCAKKLENGKPLSRAKAKSCRDAVAMLVIQQNDDKTTRIEVITVAPPVDCVAFSKTWMNGNPFMATRDSCRCEMSPRQKQNATSMAKPRVPLKIPVAIMALGSVYEASWSSSLMWVAASLPSKETVGPMIPTRQATTVLDQGLSPDVS